MTASGFAARPPRQRMRPTRNNSVAPPTDAPADDNDDALLSVAPEPEPAPTFSMDEPEEVPPAVDEQGEPELTFETDAAPEETPPGGNSVDAAEDSPATTPPAEGNAPEPEPAGQEATQPAPETMPDPPAEAAEEPAPATSAPKASKASKAAPKASKGRSAKTATNTPSPVSEDAPAAATQPGAALAVINADGSVTVGAGVHLVDLRDVAAQTDPHALVDMLTALRTVDASDLRETVTTAIVDAITAASLGN